MMAQKLMSDNKDNPFNSRFFQPSDAYSKQQTRPIQGDLTLGNIASYFMPFSKDIGPYEDSPRLDRPGGVNFDYPQLNKDIYSGLMKFDKIRKGQATLDEIKQFGFDASMNLAGGGMAGSRIRGFVPEGSLGIFAGKSAKNFPAKSLLQDVDKTKINKLNEKYSQLKDKIYSDDLTQKQRAGLNNQEISLIKNINAENFRITNQEKKVLEPLDKFMEKQDFRPGFENPTGRFEASKREFGTGLFKLPDGQYRFEIDDTVASLKNLDDAFINQGEFHEIVANVAGAKNIQLDAVGSLNTFFNSKNAVKLPAILNHKELFDNYPQLKDLKVAFYNDPSTSSYGAFYESANAININVGFGKSKLGDNININTPEQKEKILDILVHEVQHKVQDIENFTPGSNMRESEMRFLNFKNSVESRQDNFRNGYISYETLSKPLSALNDALYIKKLDEYIAKDTGYQPRLLFGQSDWYRYGDEIRSKLSRELGYSYPKVKSNKRDVWIKGAYGKLKDKSLNKMRFRQARGEGGNIDYILESSSLKEIKSEIGKVTRKQNKYFKDYLEFKKLNNKLVSLNKFKSNGHSLHEPDAFDKYQIILGEAEARAVQARRGKTITTPNFKNKFSDSETFEKTYFPPDQFKEGKMVNPPSYFNLTLDDLVT